MYASAWIFVSAPIVVSFSTSEPRPRTTSSPISTRSRTQDWSPTITRAPIRVPAKTIAPVETIVPAPISAGGERLALRGRARRERRLLADDGAVEDLAALAEHRARVDDRGRRDLRRAGRLTQARPRATPGAARARARRRARRSASRAVARPPRDEIEEVPALEPQRLVVRDLGAEDVAGARAPLAVASRTGCPAPSRRPSPCARAPCRRRRPSSRARRPSSCRILCGSSHDRCMCAMLPDGKRR